MCEYFWEKLNVNHFWEFKVWRDKTKGNDHKLKKLLIVKQILLVSTLGNV